MNNYRYVVAIDYGTSASGYAWAIANSTRGDKGKARNLGNIQFNADLHSSGGKISSDLVTDPKGKLIPWEEYESGEQRCRNRIGEETLDLDLLDDNLFQHKRVKMDLYDPQSNRDEGYNVIGNADEPDKLHRIIRNVKFDTVDLIAQALRELSERALEDIRQEQEDECPPPCQEIQWIITLPANATEAQKGAMREAARRAGIIDSTDADNLFLAFEPEVAAAYIYVLDSFRDRCVKFSQNREFILFLVDAGGGTVDVSAYLCDSSNEKVLREAGNSRASNAGSTYIDQAIFAYIRKEYFPSDDPEKALDWQKFQQAEPQAYRKFRKLVTGAKEGYRKGKDRELGVNGEYLRRYCEAGDIPYNRDKFEAAYNEISLPGKTFEGFVEEQFNKARNAIKDVARQVKTNHPNVPICYTMVGGLGCSQVYCDLVEDYFQNTLVDELSLDPDKVKYHTLHNNNNIRKTAVLQGAVLFGDEPTMIARCFSRHTFGTEDLVLYDDKRHKGRKTCWLNYQKYVDDLAFTPFIKQGDQPQSEHFFYMQRWSVVSSKKYYAKETVNVKIPLWEILDDKIPEFLKDTERKKLIDTYEFKVTCNEDKEASYVLAFTADNTEMRIKAIDCSNDEVVLDKPVRFTAKIWKRGV